jgi:threonine dehydratase
MIPHEWISEAARKIEPHIHETPLTYDRDNDLYIKWENHQITGSFKVRGAFNKILNLEEWERQAGLLAASAGNHGQGVALAGSKFNLPVTIFAPEDAPTKKINAMREFGAQVHLVPGGYGQAENAGLARAKESQATWISPYNDGHVIAGQATLGMEVIEQLAAYPHVNLADTVWLVPASGGGLVSGVGAALESLPSPPTLVAVQTEAAAYLHALYTAGSQAGVREAPTLADGLAGPVEANAITIPMVKRYVDEFVLVSEDEIAAAIALAWQHYQECIEGAAAVVLAAVMSAKITQRPAVLIISGGNIDEQRHQALIKAAQG